MVLAPTPGLWELEGERDEGLIYPKASSGPRMARRLAAIMFTDVVGYTASAQADEASTLARLQEQSEIVRPLFVAFGGREIKSTGDGSLVEFESALGATQCAVEIQRQLKERNSRAPDSPIKLRIGIHVGDVEETNGDVLGDTVNVAARIVPLAEPGGVCLSGQVSDHLRHKFEYGLERLGPQSLKGVQQSITIFRVVLPAGTQTGASGLPSNPRLAVLPFANISPDPKDEFFADGLTEELITILSQLRNLRVIARTSVLPYKTSPKPVSVIGEELGVGTVLEGSVRKAGDRLRITVQLIDVPTQEHTWSETYDRKLEDVFAVQSEVANRVAESLQVKIGSAERRRLETRPNPNPQSYLAYLRGRNAMLSSYSKASFEAAEKDFNEAISLDPGNARAYAGLAQAKHFLRMFYSSELGSPVTEECQRLAARAIELDPDLAEAHSIRGVLLYDSYEWEAAEREAKIALSLDPSSSTTRLWYASLLEEEARAEEALGELRLALEADPQSAMASGFTVQLLLYLRRLDEAKAELDRLQTIAPNDHNVRVLVCFYLFVRGDTEGALREVLKAEQLPDGSGYRGPSLQRAILYALTGEPARAREILDSLKDMPKTTQTLLDRAWVYEVLGDIDECFRLLNEAFDSFAGAAVHALRLDPLFEPARRDPRYHQFLKKLKLE